MDKHARYSNHEVIWTSHGPYTGRQPRVNHSGGFGCLAFVLVVAVIAIVEIAGPDAFMAMLYEISALLLY